jgi:hypothetical protein
MLGFCSALYLFIGIIPMVFFVEGVNFRSAKDSIGMTSMERYMRRSRFEAHDVFQSSPPIHHNAIIAKIETMRYYTEARQLASVGPCCLSRRLAATVSG